MGPQALAVFVFATGFAWNLKPLAGLLSDNVVLFGTRRKHYLLLSAFFGGLGWLLLWLLPKTYTVLLWMLVVINTLIMLASTALGGLLVDTGKRNSSIGRLTSQRMAMQNLVSLIAGPIGGFLASQAFGVTIGICAGCLMTLAPLVLLFLHEEPQVRTGPTLTWSEAGAQFKGMLDSRPLWWGLLMCCLLHIAPGFGTPLLFYQQDTLKLSPQFMGNLGIISGGAGLVAAVIYFKLCSHIPLRRLLVIGIVCNVVSTLFYLGYHSTLTAILIEGSAGFVGTLAALPLWDLCGRATPKKNEALGYSLMMAVMNLTSGLSNWLGAWFYEHLHWNFKNLVWLNAGTTALVLLIVPLLPAVLMDRRDGETEEQVK